MIDIGQRSSVPGDRETRLSFVYTENMSDDMLFTRLCFAVSTIFVANIL